MQAQRATVKVRVSRSRNAAGGELERVETTIRKMRTGSGRATISASKAVKVEVVEEAVVEPVRIVNSQIAVLKNKTIETFPIVV